jgi:CheY-like chemotaxis protein
VEPSRELILLAEDNSDDVLIFRRALRQAQVSCALTVVNDGQEAIDYLAGDGLYHDRQSYPLPSLILLDLKMPGKSGFDVLEWRRQNDLIRNIPAVVLTSSPEARDMDKANQLGASGYLLKPPTPEKLLEVLNGLSCASK